jgi:hypothetical protein
MEDAMMMMFVSHTRLIKLDAFVNKKKKKKKKKEKACTII